MKSDPNLSSYYKTNGGVVVDIYEAYQDYSQAFGFQLHMANALNVSHTIPFGQKKDAILIL